MWVVAQFAQPKVKYFGLELLFELTVGPLMIWLCLWLFLLAAPVSDFGFGDIPAIYGAALFFYIPNLYLVNKAYIGVFRRNARSNHVRTMFLSLGAHLCFFSAVSPLFLTGILLVDGWRRMDMDDIAFAFGICLGALLTVFLSTALTVALERRANRGLGQ